MSFIESLFTYEFLSRALITAAIVGIVTGAVGSLVTLRGLSLMGDAMSHAILPGVALSFILNIPMFIGALCSGLLTSVLIESLTKSSKTKNDAAIGIVFTAFFSIGVIMISLIQSTTNLYHILFGNILTVTNDAMIATSIVGIVVLLIIILCFKALELTTFDETLAKMNGFNPTFWHYLVMLMLACVTVVSLQTVGIILVVSMLITPASSAFLIAKSLKTMMFLSSFFGLVSAVIGMYISYLYNIPSGACIVLISTGIYLIIFIVHKLKFLEVSHENII
ncbi:metal ABC transporter permease [Macrococcus sp. DPC7161]|uniref:metal ABC transporter permease n=1 Tax=Macrococcus sp. DPC7161 TaxID=2507060 RepID=UPI00100A6EC5|nr:metal ABC transporter permease [Macrococcus sp. DPC7161]RXK18611.1 metal ABC transporter permease [Macrococcus sp. DPC7161]